MNIIAVASLRSLAAIILVVNRAPGQDVLDKAEEEGIVLLGSEMSAFEVIGKLYELEIDFISPSAH